MTRKICALVLTAVLLAVASACWSFVPASAEGEVEYTVRAGDSLTRIAVRYGLTVDSILALNPAIEDINSLTPGQVIFLPAGRSEGPPTPPKRLWRWEVEADGTHIAKTDHFYYVHGGDNWLRVARKYGITMEDLRLANPQIPALADFRKGELVHIPVEKLGEGVFTFYETE